MQLAYFVAPADWAKILINISYLTVIYDDIDASILKGVKDSQ